MRMTGNTILVTGGGSGIGRAMAAAFHALGNQVIVAGRRPAALEEVARAHPGMRSLVLDLEDAAGIEAFAERMARDFPTLDTVVNNAGIMRMEDLTAAPDFLADAEATIAINLLGPIRLTAHLLPLLRKQSRSAVLMVSSGLAFVPKAATPTYSATKAALHSYTLSLRRQLQGSGTQVIEIAPPYVRTHLTGERHATDPQAMPLDAFIAEVMQLLTAQPEAEEIIVERCKPLRHAAENGTFDAMFQALAQ